MTVNESDLIAYQLNELSPRRSRAVQRALTADPELAAEAEAIAWTLRAFSHAPTPTVDAAVLDRNWNSLRPSLTALPAETPSFWRRPLTLATGLVLAAAAIIGVAFLATEHIPVRPPNTITTNSAPSTAKPTDNTSAGHATGAPITNLSSRPEAAFSAAGAERPAASPTTASSLRSAARNYAALSPTNTIISAEDKAPLALSPASPAPAAPLQSKSAAADTIAVSAQSTAGEPPLRASITNSVPLHDSVQTLHTYSATTQPPTLTNHPVRQRETDVSLGVYASLDTASTASFTGVISAIGSSPSTQTTRQTVDPAAGVLVAFHQQLRPFAGYQVAAGYTRQAFNTTTTSSTGVQSGLLLANAYEVSAAYAIRGPHSRHISSHITAGGGALDFVPSSSTTTHRVLRPAGLFTIGVDYHIKRRWSLRAEYRALFFKSPNFGDSTSTPVVTGYTVASEPTISLNYRFDSLIRP
ncbi:MAG: hypothetical protein V4555_19990 [Acidobacteriota bacterium]